MSDLEARYRRLFAAYPAAQRAEREDEMVGLLLDLAEPGQRRPSRREALSIVTNGLACRARSAEEWRAGLACAGAVAVVVAVAMAVVGLGVAVLPGHARLPGTEALVPGAEAPAIAGWAAAVVALGLAIGWPPGRLRPVVTALVLVVGVGLVAAGPQLVGPLRHQLMAFALFLALSLAAADTSWRARAGAVAGGLALGLAQFGRFLGENTQLPGYDDGPGWEWQSRWVLAADAVRATPTLWYALVALGVAGGLLRPRFAVAAAALAVPTGLLAFHELARIPVGSVLVVSAAVVVLVAVALGRRAAVPPRPAA
jgi:hypothetical protein